MKLLFLHGGSVIDGSGAPARRADVLVGDGVVRAIGDLAGVDLGSASAERRDVTGAVVCPGFVDIHTHSDLTLLANPTAPSKVRQGVTTEVVGNCGLGVAPLPDGADHVAIRAAVSYLDLDPAVAWTWRDLPGYLAALEAARPSVNVASLVAHLVLRGGVVGFDDRPATGAEIDTMCALLDDALDAGAIGLSTGLVYAPLTFSRDEELLALARTVARHGKVFTWHVRNYDDDLIPSVQQALDVARRTGCRTQISHLAVVGRRNWGAVSAALDLVDGARAAGLSVGVDIYPYLHGNAPLAQLLPAWVQEGGLDARREQLQHAAVRTAIRSEWVDRAVPWSEITISWVADPDRSGVLGRSVADLAVEQGVDGDDVVLDLLAGLGTGVMMVAGGRSEGDLRTVLAHPATVVASDGLSLDPDGVTGAGVPHPRSYGCFPRYLSRYAATDPAGFAEAVARCTSRPAQLAGLADRGWLRVGAPADLVVFRPGRLTDRATFTDPQQFAAGIDLVVVNGDIVVDGERHTGQRPGQVLRT
ncbi:MAG: N-acyl-D-amino-acid deacylase [Pseudonocardiales bacterium]|jgi:N-acyl-D-amino-acid deacylase|nr:N-acyl-D-amino-acid deacylase [Pseudonocardiales bacterium]